MSKKAERTEVIESIRNLLKMLISAKKLPSESNAKMIHKVLSNISPEQQTVPSNLNMLAKYNVGLQ